MIREKQVEEIHARVEQSRALRDSLQIGECGTPSHQSCYASMWIPKKQNKFIE